MDWRLEAYSAESMPHRNSSIRFRLATQRGWTSTKRTSGAHGFEPLTATTSFRSGSSSSKESFYSAMTRCMDQSGWTHRASNPAQRLCSDAQRVPLGARNSSGGMRGTSSDGYLLLVIIWLNGGFAAGKTTLAEELHRRLPDAIVCNPEHVGFMLWKWIPPNDDFQDLPSWRELVVATVVSLRKHHADTVIVRMSLIRDAYRAEILGALADAGEEVLHVFLEADADVLRRRLGARGTPAENPGAKTSAREWAFSRVDAAVAAAARQPKGTLILSSDKLTPAELADEVMAAAGFGQVG